MSAMALTAKVLRQGRLPSMVRRAPMMWVVRPRLLPLRSRGPEQGSSPVVQPPKDRQLPPQAGRLSPRPLPYRPSPRFFLLPPPPPRPPPPPPLPPPPRPPPRSPRINRGGPRLPLRQPLQISRLPQLFLPPPPPPPP